MQSDPPQTSNPAESLDQNLKLDPIATDISAIETELAALKARYHQVQTDEALRITLQTQHSDLLSSDHPDMSDTQAELKTLTTQLDELEIRLESRLLSWLGIRQYWELSLPHRKCLLHSGLPQTTDRKKQPNPGFEKHLIFGPSLP